MIKGVSKVAFNTLLTTHLILCKGVFSCSVSDSPEDREGGMGAKKNAEMARWPANPHNEDSMF